jgi:hypothetical protein
LLEERAHHEPLTEVLHQFHRGHGVPTGAIAGLLIVL